MLFIVFVVIIVGPVITTTSIGVQYTALKKKSLMLLLKSNQIKVKNIIYELIEISFQVIYLYYL